MSSKNVKIGRKLIEADIELNHEHWFEVNYPELEFSKN